MTWELNSRFAPQAAISSPAHVVGCTPNWGPGVAPSSPCGMALILFRIGFSFFKSGKLSWLRSVFEQFLILPPSQASNVELQTAGNVLEGVSLKSQISNRKSIHSKSWVQAYSRERLSSSLCVSPKCPWAGGPIFHWSSDMIALHRWPLFWDTCLEPSCGSILSC